MAKQKDLVGTLSALDPERDGANRQRRKLTEREGRAALAALRRGVSPTVVAREIGCHVNNLSQTLGSWARNFCRCEETS